MATPTTSSSASTPTGASTRTDGSGTRLSAGILFGDRNPSGKLTTSWPRHIGQQPVYYDQIPGWHTDRYIDMDAEPLYAFGHGLSYTTYAYSDLRLDRTALKEGETLTVEVDVENTGETAGVEIVQLYVNDVYSSVTTPARQLKAFARVGLEPGEKKAVSLPLPHKSLALINQKLEKVVEPGEFEVLVGASSRDRDLLKAPFTVLEQQAPEYGS